MLGPAPGVISTMEKAYHHLQCQRIVTCVIVSRCHGRCARWGSRWSRTFGPRRLLVYRVKTDDGRTSRYNGRYCTERAGFCRRGSRMNAAAAQHQKVQYMSLAVTACIGRAAGRAGRFWRREGVCLTSRRMMDDPAPRASGFLSGLVASGLHRCEPPQRQQGHQNTKQQAAPNHWTALRRLCEEDRRCMWSERRYPRCFM